MSTPVRLARQMFPYTLQLTVGLLCLVVVVGANLAVPLIVGEGLFNRVLYQRDVSVLTTLTLGVLLLHLVKGIFRYGQVYTMAFISHRIAADLRNRVFEHLQRLSVGFHEQRKSGEIVARVTGDVGLIQSVLAADLSELLYNLLTLVGALVMVFFINWKLSLVAFITFPVVGWAIGLYGSQIRGFARQAQEKVADIAAILQETLMGIRVVKAFTMEEHERRRFVRKNEQGFVANMKSSQMVATSGPVVELLVVIGLAVVIWYGGHLVLANRLTPGDLISFLGLLGMMSAPVSATGRVYNLLQQALAAADRVFELLDTEPDVDDQPNAVEAAALRGEVAFRSVSFGYNAGSRVLNQIDLIAHPGQMIALVGPSGAGKTTLVNLIPRFYDPAVGRVEVDGVDVRKLRVRSLRRQIGLVPQETVLFGVSVLENIAFGRPDATEAEVIAAAKMANAHEFLMELPEGYATRVGERGARLSGGQRQRIAIARAILRDPRILILDEATAALDPQSEALVQDALQRLMKGRTTFVIAHRLSTILRADRIVVMDKGRIVEMGAHAELLALGGLYAKLYRSQVERLQEGSGGLPVFGMLGADPA